VERIGELPDALRRLHPAAARVVAAANNGAHGGTESGLAGLVDDARRVVERLSRA
jgi:hypothetical protein